MAFSSRYSARYCTFAFIHLPKPHSSLLPCSFSLSAPDGAPALIMILPPFLTPGDTIGITCPAGYVTTERIHSGKLFLEAQGYKVITGHTVGTQFHYFSATDEQRRRDLQDMLDNPDVKAIWMGRGGYGLSRIIDDLDFRQFVKHPKWICGFSDITVLHAHIQSNFGIATLHAPMPGSFKDNNWHEPFIQAFAAALKGTHISYPTDTIHPLNRPGTVSGTLVGGNLCILAHLTGSVSALAPKDKILFIEDVGEYLYNIDRMMLNLKRCGVFRQIKGLICGGWTELEDTTTPFGFTPEEIIQEHTKEYDFPVLYHFPAGHIEHNFTLVTGGQYTLEVSPEKVCVQLNSF